MTIQALEKEVLDLPPRSRIRLVEKIMASVDDFADAKTEKAWSDEIGRRVEEIESGKAVGVSAKLAMAKARRSLNEIRRISSARRK